MYQQVLGLLYMAFESHELCQTQLHVINQTILCFGRLKAVNGSHAIALAAKHHSVPVSMENLG